MAYPPIIIGVIRAIRKSLISGKDPNEIVGKVLLLNARVNQTRREVELKSTSMRVFHLGAFPWI
jgi:hypothetical protein